MIDEDKARLTRNIIAGLPGAEEGYTLDQFRKHLELYKDIDKAKLRENFAVFLKAIIPVAEEVGVRMAVHPDDPPRPILGLVDNSVGGEISSDRAFTLAANTLNN
ncbi:mannonate dehydratase, partial [Pseudomonas aeruginosa]|uniref:mannonate dehydratase n=1 Tax=Pseudomonas aeruginosa TaxID=287 RepID=UPI0031B730C6